MLDVVLVKLFAAEMVRGRLTRMCKTIKENYNQEYNKNVCQAIIIWTNLYTKINNRDINIE